MALGIYISVPFCRTKCSYCNFASDVFSKTMFEQYVERVCADIDRAAQIAAEADGSFDRAVDSIYLGGGTPTVLEAGQLARMFDAVRSQFNVPPDAEVTVESAPGTLASGMIDGLLRCGVNRVSLGVQSFVDQEAAAVGRLHKREIVLEEIDRLRSAGIANINVDLIAGLPHQNAESWEFSLNQVIATGVPHVSVYMLEVDEDSRLGRELIAGGARYHAHFVPDEDATADFYLAACGKLQVAGVAQYEISNFARADFESRHNLKYWARDPYLGFGVDSHSMLKTVDSDVDAVRLSTADSLEQYVAGAPLKRTVITKQLAIEESFFLGLRLNVGVDISALAGQFGRENVQEREGIVTELIAGELLERCGPRIRLTSRGRLLSNEVFERFILPSTASA